MWIFLTPDDVWLFRDGKPFAAGEDHRAVSLFPPTANTLQGALRSQALFASAVSLAEFKGGTTTAAQELARLIGAWGEPPPASFLRGPFLAKRQGEQITRYFPLPAHTVKLADEFRCLAPWRQTDFTANYPVEGLLPLWTQTSGEETPEEARGWLAEEHLRACLSLRGSPPIAEQVLSDADLFAREPRFGVKIAGEEKRPDEGHLFQVEFIRPRSSDPREEMGLLVETAELPSFNTNGLLQLGGELRAAQYWRVRFEETAPALASDKFSIYFATPAYFARGWLPDDWSAHFGGQAQVKLVAAALGRAQAIGGFDIAQVRQRALRRYVPAGSVYFFQVERGQVTLPPALTDDGAHIGFGHFFVGDWDYV